MKIFTMFSLIFFQIEEYDYHYKPMILEYGRKILPQLFKRNNYHTMVVGKPQPVEGEL